MKSGLEKLWSILKPQKHSSQLSIQNSFKNYQKQIPNQSGKGTPLDGLLQQIIHDPK
jgi:hypothetical protein